MKAQKITDEEIEQLKISNLPNRPTAPEEYGGAGYSAKEMKEAFDRLPLYVMEKYNDLVDDITAEGEDSVSNAIKIGLGEDITLRDFIDWFSDGRILSYIPAGGETLALYLASIRKDVDNCLDVLGLK